MSWNKELLKCLGKKSTSPLQNKSDDESTKKWPKSKNYSVLTGIRLPEVENTKILKRADQLVQRTKWIFKVISGLDLGREYIVTTKKIRVGRHPENLILLRDPKVSRFHAVFYQKGSRLFLEDLGSTNGTRVNGEIVLKKKQIFSGDQVKFGETVIQISSGVE